MEVAKQQRDVEMARGLLDLLKAREGDLQGQAGNLSIADWIGCAEKRVADAAPLSHGAHAVFDAIASVTV